MDIPELKELGMTKAELAVALGIKLESVWKWKRVPEYVQGYLLLMLHFKNGPSKNKELQEDHLL